MNNKSKKGVAPLFIVLSIFAVLVLIYLLLFIPIPSFTEKRTVINYFLILVFWIVLQVGLIYGYLKLGQLAVKGFGLLRGKVKNLSSSINRYLITHT